MEKDVAGSVVLPDNQTEIKQIAQVLQAISHPTRLKILCFLGEEEKIVNEVLDHVGTTQSNISQHIEVLRKAGVVGSRRSRNRVYCFLQTRDMLPLVAQIRGTFCQGEQESHGFTRNWGFR